jgi:O-antigen/teichoic acid export membrane protein
MSLETISKAPRAELRRDESPAAHSDETDGAAVRDEFARGPDWNKRFLAAGFWVGAGRVLGVLVTLLSNVILARLMAPADFGNFLLIVSIIGVASTVAMFGINGVMVRLVGESVGCEDRARVRQLFRLGVMVAGTSIILVGLISPVLLGLVLPQVDWAPAILGAISIAIMLIAWQQIADEGLRGFHDQRWASLLSGGQISGPLTAILLTLFVVAMAVVRGIDLVPVLWLMDLALVLTVALATYCLRHTASRWLAGPPGSRPRTHERGLRLQDVLLLGTPLMLMQVLMFATTQADVWIAGVCFNTDSVALYGVARRLAASVGMLQQIAGVAVCAAIATLNAQGKFDEMQRLLRTSAAYAALPSLLAILVLMTAGAPLLELCFGTFYRQSAGPLAVLLVGQTVVAICGSCGYLLIMTGRQNAALVVNGMTTVLLLTVGPWAGHRFGMLGVSWASTIVLALQTLCTWWLARRLVGVWTHANWLPVSIVRWGR